DKVKPARLLAGKFDLPLPSQRRTGLRNAECQRVIYRHYAGAVPYFVDVADGRRNIGAIFFDIAFSKHQQHIRVTKYVRINDTHLRFSLLLKLIGLVLPVAVAKKCVVVLDRSARTRVAIFVVATMFAVSIIGKLRPSVDIGLTG